MLWNFARWMKHQTPAASVFFNFFSYNLYNLFLFIVLSYNFDMIYEIKERRLILS